MKSIAIPSQSLFNYSSNGRVLIVQSNLISLVLISATGEAAHLGILSLSTSTALTPSRKSKDRIQFDITANSYSNQILKDTAEGTVTYLDTVESASFNEGAAELAVKIEYVIPRASGDRDSNVYTTIGACNRCPFNSFNK